MGEKIRNAVRDFRKARGWTQEDLGREAGVSRQSVISIEKGKYIPSLPLALKMAEVFECQVEDLFQLEDL